MLNRSISPAEGLASPAFFAAPVMLIMSIRRRLRDGFLFEAPVKPAPPAVHAAGRARDLRALWDKLQRPHDPLEWRVQAPLIAEINRLKREKNAVILAHNYYDLENLPRGGRLRRRQPGPGPTRRPSRDAAIIVQAGVHFMAETSKILAPTSGS